MFDGLLGELGENQRLKIELIEIERAHPYARNNFSLIFRRYMKFKFEVFQLSVTFLTAEYNRTSGMYVKVIAMEKNKITLLHKYCFFLFRNCTWFIEPPVLNVWLEWLSLWI